ncbi:MAG: trehalose-6-phosphate synthase [Candidatus Melainabacteria bacterium]
MTTAIQGFFQPALSPAKTSRQSTVSAFVPTFGQALPAAGADRVMFNPAQPAFGRAPVVLAANRDLFYIVPLNAEGKKAAEGEPVVAYRMELRAGGLTNALAPTLGKNDVSLYAGNNDIAVPSEEFEALEAAGKVTLPEYRSVGVPTADVYKAAYGFSNAMWPVMHAIDPNLHAFNREGWEDYQTYNDRMAQACVAYPGSDKNVQDFHLDLAPQRIREIEKSEGKPHRVTGYFRHIPVTDYPTLQQIPQDVRKALWQGVLGADLSGFHDVRWRYNFLNAARQDLGIKNFYTVAEDGSLTLLDNIPWDTTFDLVANPEPDALKQTPLWNRDQLIAVEMPETGEKRYVGIYPIGHDTAKYAAYGENPDNIAAARAIRQASRKDGVTLYAVSGRADYTKGYRQQVEAVSHLLKDNPELMGKVKFMIWASNVRDLPAYTVYGKQLNDAIRAVNEEYARVRETDPATGEVSLRELTDDERALLDYDITDRDKAMAGEAALAEANIWAPVTRRSYWYGDDEMAALNMAADVHANTPVMDGMNLVGVESLLEAQTDDPELSPPIQMIGQGAGLYHRLKNQAVTVDARDPAKLAEGLKAAYDLAQDETARRERHQPMREVVLRESAPWWADRFARDMDRVKGWLNLPE